MVQLQTSELRNASFPGDECLRRLDEPHARMELLRLLERMPKAELHIHIEGSLEPDLIFALAQRNRLKLKYASVEALKSAYEFKDLQSFLDLYYDGCSVLCEEEDFYEMTMAYFARAAANNVIHAEIFFDPQAHMQRGVPFKKVIRGLIRAKRDAWHRWHISSQLILCFLRHLSEQDAFDTLEHAIPFREHVTTVGLDSSERGNPPEKFSRVFERCRELGFHAVAHAGEEGPCEYITAALDVLHVDRVDHGVRCVEEESLINRLARTRVPLTVCPLSNVKLAVYPSLRQHCMEKLLRKGVCATVNSDDPAYFGGYVNDNFVRLFEAIPTLSARDAFQLAFNSIDASFVASDQKEVWWRALKDCFEACGV
eukprot:ANDGO_06656.mRNA.1 Adenine deaminase